MIPSTRAGKLCKETLIRFSVHLSGFSFISLKSSPA